MGLTIESGSGNGQLVHVVNNRLATVAVSINEINYAGGVRGESYVWSHRYNYDAGDTILLVSNSSLNKNLHIHRVTFGSDTATEWTLHSPAYPTLAGTVITGTNLNRTSGNVGGAEAYGDETGNTQANILSRGFVTANSTITLGLDGALILGYHDSIAIDFVTAGTMATATFVGYYLDKGDYV